MGPTQGERDLSLLLHDMRAALADVSGGLALVEGAKLGHDARLHLARAEAASLMMQSLTDELGARFAGGAAATVAATRAAQGPGRSLDLYRILRQVRERWSAHAGASGLRYRQTVSEKVPRFVALDPTDLQRVLSNLLDNAVKYTADGTVTLEVDLRDGDELRLSVRDDGPGFSDMSLARLFQFGGRPDDAAAPGSGLGLHIAKTLADRMGGRVCVSNCERGGAIVSLLLPAEAWQTATAVAEAGDPGQVLAGKAVLIAEDSPTSRVVAVGLMERLGARCITAPDGIAALDLLRREKIELALVDIEMPRMGGLDLIHRIRLAEPPLCDLPVIAATAYVLPQNRRDILAAGADAILPKPLGEPADVAALLRDTMRLEDPEARRRARAALLYDPSCLDHLVRSAGPHRRDELLSRLYDDLARLRDGLFATVQQRDIAGLRRNTHVLSALSRALGAKPLVRLADDLHEAAQEGSEAALHALAEAACAGLSGLLGVLPRPSRGE